jgi:uncharacterized membrane protein YqjE
MMTLFPSLFFAGLGITGVKEWIKTKRLPEVHEFIAFGAVIGIVIAVFLGSFQGEKYKNFLNFSDKISVHSEPLTSKRVNLRYLFITDSKVPQDGLSILGSRKDVYDMQKPVFLVFAFICLAITMHACWKNAPSLADASIFMGITLMYILTPIVCYYFHITLLLLILFRHYQHHKYVHIAMAFIFLGMALMLWSFDHAEKDTDNYRIVMNGMLSTYMLFVLAGIVVMWETVKPKAPELPQAHP